MTFVKELVLEFIQDHLNERDKNPKWLFDRLTAEDRKQTRAKSGTVVNNTKDNNTNVNRESEQDEEENLNVIKPVLNSLLKIAKDFEIFIGNKYNERFPELTEPLIPKLKNGSKQKYYDSFKSIADELFSQGISWSHIVTFLVYSSELTNKVIDLHPSPNDKDKTFKMVSQIIRCICRYFEEEELLHWIHEQDGGWLSLIDYEQKRDREEDEKAAKTNNKMMKQYFSFAAFAAIIGGLYLCSKLTVQ